MSKRARKFAAVTLLVLFATSMEALPRDREGRDFPSMIRRVISKILKFVPSTAEDTLSIPKP